MRNTSKGAKVIYLTPSIESYKQSEVQKAKELERLRKEVFRRPLSRISKEHFENMTLPKMGKHFNNLIKEELL